MAYVRLSGEEGFGWYQGQALTLGGLEPGRAYLLLCENGGQEVTADAQGSARVRLTLGAPLCLARDGRPALFDAGRMSREAAAALILSRARPSPAPETGEEPPEEAPPAPPEPEAPQGAQAASALRRGPADAPPVDALPALAWPAGLEALRACFEGSPPVRLLDEPGWRAVRLPGAGVRCCVARHATDDRVDEVLYAVHARGSLLPPKGLRGYRYERLADGGYWTLRQKV